MRMLTIYRQLLPDTVNTRSDSLTAQFTLTSGVTRVTSIASTCNQITMPLTVFFKSKISPLKLTLIYLERSPSVTAFVTFAIDLTWDVRFTARQLRCQ